VSVRLRISVLLSAILCAAGCARVSSFVDSAAERFTEETVARVGDHRLTRTELEKYIPAGVSSDDSLALAMQYINSWASNLVFLDVAEAQLSKEQKDVSEELEEYRISLLKYRYEQLYVNERLDTVISQEEIRKYYNDHRDKFSLERPILKAKFLVLPEDSPVKDRILKKMVSRKVDDVVEADSLAARHALRFEDRSAVWTDAVLLAREFGTDYVAMLAAMKRSVITVPDGHGNVRVAFVSELIKTGQTAPIEYCTDRIRDIILSGRKHELVSTLEQELLEDARSKENFVIY